jgi:hypothetical protein
MADPRSALDLDWSTIEYFAPTEWPDHEGASVLAHMDARLILALDELRGRVAPGHTLTPSPLARAHIRPEQRARASCGGRHSLKDRNGNPRLADATDPFADWQTWWDLWVAAQQCAFGGIGVYFDARLDGAPRPMFHFDLRPQRVLWARITEPAPDGQARQRYIYPHRSPRERSLFLHVLAEHSWSPADALG